MEEELEKAIGSAALEWSQLFWLMEHLQLDRTGEPQQDAKDAQPSSAGGVGFWWPTYKLV
eukprot:5950405-Lingulodinium_polyedra.AAC.1